VAGRPDTHAAPASQPRGGTSAGLATGPAAIAGRVAPHEAQNLCPAETQATQTSPF